MIKLLFLLACLSSSLWAFHFNCNMSDLKSFSHPWESSPDFTSLDFEGALASERFKDLGAPGSHFFSVTVHNDWCKSLQDVIMCETPFSALAEIESGDSPSAIKTKNTLRYFLMLLNYRKDGWAILRIRAQRIDTQLPSSFMIEFPTQACLVTPE